MAIFEEVRLEFGGVTHVIPPDRVMRAIATVEDRVTLAELSQQLVTRRYKQVQITEAYAALLRYAGAKVTDEEVYVAIFPKDGDAAAKALGALNALMVMMIPPALRKGGASAPAAEAGAGSGGKPPEA